MSSWGLKVVIRATINESRRGLQAAGFLFFAFQSFLIWLRFWHGSPFTEKQNQRYNLLIFAPARSGSSFLGEIFNQHQDVFFLYEPLHAYATLKRLGVFTPSKLQRRSSRLLQDAYKCNFTEHKMYLYFISHAGFSSPHFRSSSQALSTPPLCGYSQDHEGNPKYRRHAAIRQTGGACHNRLEPKPTATVCQSRKQVVIKVLAHRLPLDTVLKNAINSEKFRRLKMTHLIRDPRAIVISRLRLGWISWNSEGFVREIREICDRWRANLNSARKMQTEISGKYRVLRYEDLAGNVLFVAKKLFKDVGLELNEKVERWILRNTRWSHTKRQNFEKHLKVLRQKKGMQQWL